MSPKGFLLVIARPPAAMEEEFNAWYDTEHLPERLAVPGFLTGLRYIGTAGTGRYLALYDLERPEVLDTPDYARVSGTNFSPWTRRVTGRSRVYRAAGAQIHPGGALTGRSAFLLLVRFRALPADAGPAVVAGMRAGFDGRRNTIQVRVLEADFGATRDFLGVVESRAPMDPAFEPAPFGGFADAVDLVEGFVPY